MKHTIEMHLNRETQGAVLYEEPARQGGDPNYLIGNLYLRKAYIRKNNDGTIPISITVTVEESGADHECPNEIPEGYAEP